MHILGLILMASGLLTVIYFSGPNSSTEQVNPPLPTQDKVQALPTNPSTSSNFDYKGAKTAGYSNAEIQNYLASKAQNKNSVTPKPQATKASDKALQLSVYIFAASNENQRNDLKNKFSNGKSDLKSAVTNLALLLDSKPEALALAEKLVAQDINQKSAQKSQEDADETLEYYQKGVERIDSLNKNLGVYSQNNAYIGKIQDTNPYINDISSTTQPSTHILNTYQEAVRYDLVGDTAYGSDGSRYYKVGDSVYKNDGTRYDAVGDTLYGNDGSRYYQVGDSVYKNDGTRYDAVGDTLYGNDGSRSYRVGDSIYSYPGH